MTKTYTFDTIGALGRIPTMGVGYPAQAKRAQFADALRPTLAIMREQHLLAGGVPRKVRSWAYTLETLGLCTKEDFTAVGNQLIAWRKLGLMPIDWVSEDDDRSIHQMPYSFTDDDESIDELIKAKLMRLRGSTAPFHKPHNPWSDQERLVILGCEKSDVAELLAKAIPGYVPYFGCGGQTDLHSRVKLLQLCDEALDAGLTPTIIYVGDHDLGGYKISGGMMGDTLVASYSKSGKEKQLGFVANMAECELAAGVEGVADEIEFVRVGINLDWCTDHGIKPISNLITGNGTCLSNPRHPQHDDPLNHAYIRQFGVNKAESNALFARPREAQQWISSIIWQYLDVDAHNAWVAANNESQRQMNAAWSQISSQLDAAIDSIMGSM